MTTYAITTLHLSEAIGHALNFTGSLAQIAGFAVGVWLDASAENGCSLPPGCCSWRASDQD